MENPFSATRVEMHRLFLESRRRHAERLFRTAMAAYPYEEVERQIVAQAGPFIEHMNRTVEAFARGTENVEFVTALGLSDFYFGPEAETTMSFEMRRDFRPHPNLTYEELIGSIESDTHIDCAVTNDGTTLNFQIKRYPQAHLAHTNAALLSWLDRDVFAGYGNMNGTILIVLLQPTTPPTLTNFRFPQLSREIIARGANITFDEVALSYTEINVTNGRQLAVLHKMFPAEHKLTVSLEWMMRRFRGQA